MTGRARFTILQVALLLTLGGCDCGRPSAKPNILLVVVDTFRADHLGCYDYSRPTSPGIDALSEEGITFDAAYSTAPWTLPAFASIVTSRYPWEHGATNDYYPVAPELPTLAGELSRGGYRTAALVSHIYASASYGFGRGFDRFEDFDITKEYRFDEGREPTAEIVAGAAIDLLQSGELAEPFFLLVHLFDPHWDYGAPGELRDCFTHEQPDGIDGTYQTLSRFLSTDSLLADNELEYLIDLYDGEIRYVDHWVDSLITEFDRVGSPRKPVVLLTADHGEEFQEHQSMGHAFTFYDEVLRVPLILRDPARIVAGSRSTRSVSLIDIFPTLLDAAGLIPPDGIRGQSLYQVGESDERVLLAGTTREGRFGRAAIKGESKLIWDRNGFHLFQKGNDPREEEDLILSKPEEGARLSNNIIDETSPGGWSIRWTTDSTDTFYLKGSIQVSGFLVELLPGAEGRFLVSSSNDRSAQFTSRGSGCVHIRTEPPSAPVTFSFEVNGSEEPGNILIGRDLFSPPASSFGLDPGSTAPGLLDAPSEFPLDPAVVTIWKEGDAHERATIQLDEGEKERLRALGYF